MSSKHSIIRLRRGTAAEWAASEPQPGGEILKLGEPGYEKDTGKLKIGDGVSGWNNLPYFAGGLNDIPENIQDIIGLNINTGGFLVAGTGIGIVYDDDNNTLTISSSGSNPFDQDLNTFNSPTFNTVAVTGSQIFGGGTNSGDGNGYGTIELVPDSGLYNNDQYLIVDPTAPSHIHLRAGGTQDASNAELIIGGEKNHLRVNDFSPTVRMQTETLITLDTYYLTSPEFSSAVWETVDGNHRVVINDPSPTVYSAVGALNSTSLFYVIDDGSNYYELTINGSSAPGGSDPVVVYVNQAPPASPTTLTQLTFEIRETRQTYVQADGSDIRIQAADDVRIFSNDAFRLYNYSPTQPIEIFTDYDDQEYRWRFTADGEFISPNGATIGTNGEGALAFYNSENNNPVAIVNRSTDSGANLALVAVMPSASGGLATISVATNGGSYEYWDFKDNGILNLASNGIQFSDDSIQNTAAINVVNDALNTSLIAGSGINLDYGSGVLTISSSGIGGNPFDQNLNTTDFPRFSGVGIDTTNPNDKLHIKDGNIRLQSSQHTEENFTQKSAIIYTSQDADIEISRIEMERTAWAGAPSNINFYTRIAESVNKVVSIKDDGRIQLFLSGGGITFPDNTTQNTAGVISTNPNSLSSFVKINNIVSCSQADYDSLSPPDANTFYLITS